MRRAEGGGGVGEPPFGLFVSPRLASAVPALWVCAGPGAAVVAAVREGGGSTTAARGERARSGP